MTNAITHNAYVPQAAYQPASTASTRHSEASQTPAPEDTVQLSSTAKAAMGDAAQGDPDHDGH
ncbi:MAG TPA: hypothetical protein VMQ86_18920 [Bryobacteraceae bacterium]|jgi:hypothetical protein|nr:hypothetical protein [Bryobacteraceae bacterium]